MCPQRELRLNRLSSLWGKRKYLLMSDSILDGEVAKNLNLPLLVSFKSSLVVQTYIVQEP